MTTKTDSRDAVEEAEIRVLGALLLEGGSVGDIVGQLAPADFVAPAHAKIFAAMLHLEEKGSPITVPTVAEALGTDLTRVGGMEYLQQLCSYSATTANLVHHARLVRKHRQRRDLFRIGREIATAAREGLDDLPGAVDHFVGDLLAVVQDATAGQMVALAEELGPAYRAAEEARQGRLEACGLQTGFAQLDAMLSGLKPGNLDLLAARPGMGKSAFAMNVAASVVKDTKKTVLIFSLEMSARELAYRLVAADGDLNAQRLMRGRLDAAEWRRFAEVCNAAGPTAKRLLILDQGLLTPSIMRAHLRREQRRADIGLVIVDYVQLMASGLRRENQNVEIGAISRALKILARDFGIPILALSQLNRAVENRAGQMPRLADLRDSGSLEQDADVVILIHREEGSDLAKFIVAKQRNGPKGTIELRWNATAVRFENR